MNLTVQNESSITAEAMEILMDRLSASKVTRLLSAWQVGNGDYLKLRDELFTDESVESLCNIATLGSLR